MTAVRVAIAVRGVVQGVGFRPFVHREATRLGVRGSVANQVDGVAIDAEAEAAVLDAFVVALRERAPAAARIDELRVEAGATGACSDGFRIVASRDGDGSAVIAPDLATCAACVDEIFDPSSRRYRYPFTSCASCGPRLTIVASAPYDRARTTMAPFAMCAACRAEHDDPADRRFHAQPIACPACGPRLSAIGLDGEPVAAAAAALLGGAIVALKGLGGYHLACDASSDDGVAALRRRKRREARPFAIMVADLATARAIAEVDDDAAALLASPVRPIVLVPRRRGALIAAAVAPDGGDLGLMLPYTPLHHLILRAVERPLVMTSGNRSDEPIAFDDADARQRLGDIADAFVVHDRAIHTRCDDSVARVVAGAPLWLRRSRGCAPAPVRLPVPLSVPTVALGGHQKAVFALGDGHRAVLSPHHGDLDDARAYEAFVAGLAHLEALHRIAPRRVVCDRHPDYATSRLADDLACAGLERIAVGHHHAHLASALADAGIAGPAIGVCFDGAGLGDDGTIWGGEILVGDARGVERAAHLRMVPLPGGDRAAAEPWRMAIAYLRMAGVADDALAARFGDRARAIALLCDRRALAPPTSSAGRLFDAVAALIGLCGAGERAAYDAQPAMRVEALARSVIEEGRYPFALTGEPSVGPVVIDTAPLILAILDDAARGVAPARIARRFHATLVEIVGSVCEAIAVDRGVDRVVITGGVFQNAILAAEVPRRLRAGGLEAHAHRQVPPGDGGLCLGQLAIVAAREVA